MNTTAVNTNVNDASDVKEELTMKENETMETMANFQQNYYGQPTYAAPQYQLPAAPPQWDTNYIAANMGNAYTAADMNQFYQQPAPFGQAAWGNQPFTGMIQKPAEIRRGPNFITNEEKAICREESKEEWVVDPKEIAQARCSHKITDGQNAGLYSGHQIKTNDGTRAWHCDECNLDWVLADMGDAEFQQALNVIFNVINTDKFKSTNINKAITDGVMAGLPVLRLFAKYHELAGQDFQNSKNAVNGTYNEANSYGAQFVNPAGVCPFPQAPTPAVAPTPQQFYGQFNPYGAPYGYQQPAPSYGYQQPMPAPAPYQGAPQYQIPGNVYQNPNPYQAAPAAPQFDTSNSPLIGGGQAAPQAAAPAAAQPAAPAAKPYAPTVAGTPDVTGGTSTTTQTV